MISVSQAKKIILKNTQPTTEETAGFLESDGCVLAQDIAATSDLPPFSRATVDGFALKSLDTKTAATRCHKWFRIVDVVQAGCPSQKILRRGEAIKIMTGGVIPRDADCVVMKEITESGKSGVCILKEAQQGDGISFKGESAKKGNLLLKKGNRVSSGVVSLLATLGIVKINVYRRPRVAILVTGNELLDVKEKLRPGKIRSANQYGLFSQIKEAGGAPVMLGIARDNLRETRKKILQGLRYDCFIVSGGVSVGDFDLAPKVLKSLGVKILIERISMQPGKPLIFGKKGKTYIFGLPGNPVSTMVCFYEFVRPFLLKMQGAKELFLSNAAAILDEEIHLQPSRTKILRGNAFLRNGELFVKLTGHQGSGNVLSLAEANCLFAIAEGVTKVKKGSRVIIQYLP